MSEPSNKPSTMAARDRRAIIITVVLVAPVVILIVAWNLWYPTRTITTPAPAVISQPQFKADRVACLSKQLFDQSIEVAVRKDDAGLAYLLGHGCILPKAGTKVSILDSSMGWYHVRAYSPDGIGVELWTTREAIAGI